MSPFDYHSAISSARSRFDKSYPLRLHDDCLGMLTRHAGNLTSQTGEDGIIAGILERIGTRNRWCFEVGAADGQRLSNTWALFRDGWQCVFCEGGGLVPLMGLWLPSRSFRFWQGGRIDFEMLGQNFRDDRRETRR